MSATDDEYKALQVLYGPGLSLSDMRMKRYGGPTVPAQSVSDLEYAYFGAATPPPGSMSDREYTYYKSQTGSDGKGSLSDMESGYWASGGSLIAQLFAQQTFFVGHRGSGEVWPEHTQQGYQNAFDVGAKALEFSIQQNATGKWFHLHDTGATGLNRTTSRTGDPSLLTDAEVNTTTILQPDCGWWWIDNPPAMPWFVNMMTLFYNKVVIFLESKVYLPAAWDNLLSILENNYPGYQQSVIWKSHVGGTVGMDKAKAKGMRVWCYIDFPLVPAQLDTAANYDYIGIPVSENDEGAQLSDAEISTVVARGKPVIEWSSRLRATRDRLKKPSGLGVQGFVSRNELHTRTNVPNRTTDAFASGRAISGDLSPDVTRKYTLDKALGTMKLAGTAASPAICMGSMSPAGNLFTIDYDFMLETLPTDLTFHTGCIFSKPDDRRWRFQAGDNPTGGYHIIMRANGTLALYSHPPNNTVSNPIGSPVTVATDPIVAGQWNHIQIEVTATQVTAQRTTGSVTTKIVANDTSYRGTYFHLSRNYPITDASYAAHFKNVVVVQK